MDRKKSVVMVVDDVESEIDILVETLGEEYEVCVATDGYSALELAPQILPDLILLDVLMPGIDGYEVCRRLKADPDTRAIPIIFVTVLDKEGDEATGLSLGALDYVTKPFSVAIVRARIRNHMAMIEAARMREEVNRIMHHDMRNALAMVVGFPDLILQAGPLNEKQKQLVEKIRTSGHSLLNMINLGIQLYKMEYGRYEYRPATVDLAALLRGIVLDMEVLENAKNLRLALTITGRPLLAEDRFTLRCEDLLCYSMLSNLILNAVEAAPPGTTVAIDMQKDTDARISIHNQGAVPEEIRNRFFDKYVTAGKVKGSGIGTYSAMLMARAHGGTITMSTSEQEGTTVTVHLPL